MFVSREQTSCIFDFLGCLQISRQHHTSNPTHNHDGPQSLPLCLGLFSLLSSSLEFVTSDISQYLSQHREIQFDICSFYQLYSLFIVRTGTGKEPAP